MTKWTISRVALVYLKGIHGKYEIKENDFALTTIPKVEY